MGRCAAPTVLRDWGHTDPALTLWANVWRAAGAAGGKKKEGFLAPTMRTGRKTRATQTPLGMTVRGDGACSVGGDGGGGGGLAEGVGGVERVRGGGAGGDDDGGATGGAYCWGDDDVGGARHLPGESDRRARCNRVGAGDELRDLRGGAGGHVGVGVERRNLDDIEIGGSDAAEIVEIIVAPTIVGGAADVHGRAVVRHDEAVFFHGVEDDLICGGVGRDVEGGLEAKTRAHGKRVGVAG